MRANDIYLIEFTQSADAQLDEIEGAYQELELLARAFHDHDFGLLIGRPGRRLTDNDVVAIKRKLHEIFTFNVLLNGSNLDAQNKRLRNLGQRAGHAIEAALLAAGSVAIVGIGAASAVTTGGAASATAIGVGAAGLAASGALFSKQVHTMQALKAGSRLMGIVDTMHNIGRVKYQPSAWQKFKNWWQGKTPEEIRFDMQREVQIAAFKARKHIDELVADLPHEISYVEDGVVKKMPIELLFDF